MRILVSAIIDVKKAAPNRLHHFLKYLSKNHDITVICINDSWKAKQVNMESQYKDFPDVLSTLKLRYITEKPISPIKQEIFSPIFLRNVKEFEEEKFDILFNYNTLMSGYYLAKKLTIPMVYDIADDLPAMISNSPQIPSYLQEIGKWIGERMVERTIKQSVKICAISDVFRTNHSIPQEKFQIIPNGVDTSLFKKVESPVREDLNITSNFVLGYVGVLREWVDLTPVYQALQKLDDTKLLIIGQEGLYEENREMVKNLGIEDKVIFTGNIPYADVPHYIAAMDVCLIPFKDNAISHNAVPLKLFEYMACEKPVISTNLEGVKNSVGDRIFYCDKPDDYYSTIKSLQNKEESVNSLQNNRRYIEDHFEWRSIGASVEQILEEIV